MCMYYAWKRGNNVKRGFPHLRVIKYDKKLCCTCFIYMYKLGIYKIIVYNISLNLF